MNIKGQPGMHRVRILSQQRELNGVVESACDLHSGVVEGTGVSTIRIRVLKRSQALESRHISQVVTHGLGGHPVYRDFQ